MDVPGRSALRIDRIGNHSSSAVPRRHHYGPARRVRQSAVDRRDRPRHHCRCHRNHGGEYLSPSRPRRAPRSLRSRHTTVGEIAPHLGGGLRGRSADFILGDHYHRGVPAAVHHAGRGRPDLRSDVAHLRLRLARRVIATFTVTPVIASLLLPERVTEVETFVVRQIRKVYQFVLPLAVRRYRLSAMIALAFLAICGMLATRIGTEFLPKLEEGNLWIRGMMPPTIALDAG